MKILRQLIQDAQTVLRDMSVTQRVAVTALILTIAAWLTGAAYLGSRGETASGEVPLPITISPLEYREVVDALKKQGFNPEYRMNEQLIVVPAKEEQDAFLFLVSNQIVNEGNLNRTSLDQMVERISFTDTSDAVRRREGVARANSVARLIAKFDMISEADVIFSDEKRSSIFLGSAPTTAAVTVKTKFGRPLDEGTAQTIITLVSLSKGGLKPDNVVVTDRTTGRQFRNQDRFSATALAASRLDLERQYDERLRRKVEEFLYGRFPLLADGGKVTIVPTYAVNTDMIERSEVKYEEGVATEKRTHSEKERRLEGPPYEPGVQPNVATSTVVDAENAGRVGVVRRESSRDVKTAETKLIPSRSDQVVRPAPAIEDVTISVLIQLPYELERDESGNTIPDVDEYGEALLDPETRRPMLRKKSVALLTDDELRGITVAVANVAQIPPDKVAEKVYVEQIAWRPPVYAEPGAEPMGRALMRAFRENFVVIGLALLMAVALLIAIQQARLQLQTTLEEDEEIEEQDVRENLAAEVPEEDPTQVEMEATRIRVREAVLEDPKRAALLVRRWMTKEG